ncbi:unnamed protein product, partial [Brenthis ino]
MVVLRYEINYFEVIRRNDTCFTSSVIPRTIPSPVIILGRYLTVIPRNYQRKTEIKYKLEDLERAFQAVNSKTLTLGKAASIYSVPKITIYDYLKKDAIKTPNTGRKDIFSEEQEKELVKTKN